MHYIKHNFTDWDFATKHMNRIEKTIFLDLRSDYFCQEKPIDAGKPELLERRLNIQSEEEKQALEFVLKDRFTKKDGKYRVLEWDKIIKDYRHQELITAVGDMTRRLKQAGFEVPFDSSTPAIREAYLNQFGADKLTRITKNANANNETANGESKNANGANGNANASGNGNANGESDNANAPMTNAERQAKSKAERKFLVDRLREVGEQVTLKTAINDLRNLYNDRFGSDAIDDMGKQTSENANETKANKANANGKTLTANGANENANGANESENQNANESNERKTAITINHKPLTMNHEPLTKNQESESALAQIADVNNSVDNIKQQQDTKPQSANTAPTTSSQIKNILQQNSAAIENWQAPSLDDIRSELFRAEIFMTLDEKLYARYLREFKIYYKANPIAADDDLRKLKLVGWLEIEAKKQKANQSRQTQVDNRDWSQVGQASSGYDSDLPSGFHPSHSQFADASKSRPVAPASQDWYWKDPLPGMSIPETENYIKARRQGGETPKQTYDRVIVELQRDEV